MRAIARFWRWGILVGVAVAASGCSAPAGRLKRTSPSPARLSYVQTWVIDKACKRAEDLTHGGSLYSVCMTRDGKSGLAVGDFGPLRWNGSAWSDDEITLRPADCLQSGCLSVDGKSGWAVGSVDQNMIPRPVDRDGIVFRWTGSVWLRDASASRITHGAALRGVCTSQDVKSGWAVGDGVVLRCDNSVWSRDARASKLAKGACLFSVCTSQDGRSGWAVGADGLVLRLVSVVKRNRPRSP